MNSPDECPILLVGEGGSGQAHKGPGKNIRPLKKSSPEQERANYDLAYDSQVGSAAQQFIMSRMRD